MDVDIGLFIESYSLATTGLKIGMMLNMYFALYVAKPGISTAITILRMTSYYFQNDIKPCPKSYYLSSNYCFKNFTYAF